MKQKSIFLLALCALLLLGCLGCGEKPAATIPKIDPILLPTTQSSPLSAYNITPEKLVESFNAYSKSKGLLTLNNMKTFDNSDSSVIESVSYSFSDYSYVIILFRPEDKNISSISISTPTDQKHTKERKTWDALIRFLLEIFEPTEKGRLETLLDLDSNSDLEIGTEKCENSIINYNRSDSEEHYNFMIYPR